ncbi:MAG TPA: phytanoyl-CoA dioxygenase family protein [Tepidisphaeraceae bacterium]|nr:phytanoyl-CoA dioxygenase family protein [Tepidisphaeraceae bacterium]
MSDDVRATLATNGFAIIDSYLGDDDVRRLLASLDVGPAPVDDIDASLRARRGVVFARRNLLSSPTVRTFAGTTPVRSLVDAVAPGAAPVRAILFDKTGDANWTVPWHQDRSIAVRRRADVDGFGPWSEKAGVVHVQPPPAILREMLTLRFSLDPCDTDNGPLRVIPATHHRILDQREVADAAGRGPETLCTTAAGGVVLMRPLILHASSPARRVGHRRVLHVEFGPPTLPGGLQWAVA